MHSTQQLIMIKGSAGLLEAVVEQPQELERDILGIICHPHPLQGGTMNNKVVTTVVRAFHKLGITTLRFNFRGVGKSGGQYGHTKGEVDDLLSVMTWARDPFPTYPVWLAGFSFGSFITAKVASENPISQLISIAPPVNNFDFAGLPPMTLPWLIIQGDHDEVVPPALVFEWVKTRNPQPRLIVMEGVGHFFHGKLIELRETLVEALS